MTPNDSFPPVLSGTSIDQVYEFYDYPILFVARTNDGSDTSYLHLLVESVTDDDPTKSYTRWLAAPVSQDTLEAYDSKDLSIKEIFSNPDITPHQYEFDTRYSSSVLKQTSEIAQSDLPDDLSE